MQHCVLYNTGIIDRLKVTNKDIYLNSLCICSNFKMQFWLLSHYQFNEFPVRKWHTRMHDKVSHWHATRKKRSKKIYVVACQCDSFHLLAFIIWVHVSTCFSCESQQLIQSCEFSHITQSKYSTVNERPKLMVKVQDLTVI